MELSVVLGIAGYFYVMVIYCTLIRLNRGERVILLFQLQKAYNIVSPAKWFNNSNNFVGITLWVLSPIIWPVGLLVLIWLEGMVERLERGGPM